MTGWAFILLVWLEGLPQPVQDASLYIKGDLPECQEHEANVRDLYEVGAAHPVYGVKIVGWRTWCLRMPKPAEGEET